MWIRNTASPATESPADIPRMVHGSRWCANARTHGLRMHPPADTIKHTFPPLWGSSYGCWPTRWCLGSGMWRCTCGSYLKSKPTARLAAANYRGASQTVNPHTCSGLSGPIVGVPRCWLMAVNAGVGSPWGSLHCCLCPEGQAGPCRQVCSRWAETPRGLPGHEPFSRLPLLPSPSLLLVLM